MSKRPSPDNVIDLTASDEPDEDRRQELDSLRKKFRQQHNAAGAASVSAEGTSSQQSSNNNNNDTSSESSGVMVTGTRQAQAQAKAPPAFSFTKVHRRLARRRLNAHRGVPPDVTLSLSTVAVKRERPEEEANVTMMVASVKREGTSAHNSSSSNNNNNNNNNNDDGECLVVAPPAKKIRPANANNNANSQNSDNDIEVVGTANEVKLPHMRQHCLECRFVEDSASNKEYCSLCYCFVCDVLAKDCTAWEENHCHANDTGTAAIVWKRVRSMKQSPASASAGSVSAFASAPRRTSASMMQDFLNAGMAASAATTNRKATGVSSSSSSLSSLKAGAGPFSPDDAFAATDENLTKCRKCGWFNRFFHRNFRYYQQLHPTGFLDWCHTCGRVASEKDFAKEQSKPYRKQLPGDVYLGKRKIEFQIFAHDPRQMAKFAGAWSNANENSPEWTYDEAEMKKDLFEHRFGKHPTPAMILESIPIVEEDNIPKDGSFHMEHVAHHYEVSHNKMTTKQRGEDQLYTIRCCPGRGKFSYWQDQHGASSSSPSADETEGIILVKKDPNDVAIFRELALLHSKGFCDTKENSRAVMPFRLGATWNEQTQTGVFTLRLYARPDRLNPCNEAEASLAKLLGAWYGVFPFALTDICGTMKAKKGVDMIQHHGYRSATRVSAPPFRLSYGKLEEVTDKIEPKVDKAVQKYNQAVDAKANKLTLESSQENRSLGGTCPLELGFANVLKRYFTEVLPEDIVNGDTEGITWIDEGVGVVSGHRKMRKGGSPLVTGHGSQYSWNVSSYLRTKDVPLAVVNLRQGSKSLIRNVDSMKSLIDHCENLGHAEIQYFEGLNCELLPFQRQSVQWAWERETMDGGTQSLLWPELPKVADRDTEVYFSPLLQAFRTDKPGLCRGGIIAEEMGLGKTIISLSLILVNPPPPQPESGSSITALDAIDDSTKVTWDKGLYARTSSDKKKRGSIISRGTLVICPVSLVGQWIEEARSKLKDPGLVYPYHGSGRTRDPIKLSKNAIVVTTYEILKSDATFHAKKNGSDDYCPPVEMIRWWRVICDESQSLKQANTQKSMAVMNLVGDMKWLVSGTPVSTSLTDLKNQLNFLGISHVSEMFKNFANILIHTKDRAAPSSGRRGNNFVSPHQGCIMGPFFFLFRALQMRHAQQMTYRGTTPSTTLMSLPPKTERIIEVDFTEADREEYDALEKDTLDFYSTFRKSHRGNLGVHYLKLTAKLTPLRIACAGGRIPLDDDDLKSPEDEDDDNDNEASEEQTEDSGKKKKKKKKEVKYSDFSFNSKMNKLIQELKDARDKDPTAKSLVFSQFQISLKHLQELLPKHGFQFRTLSGDMTMKKRAQALADFQRDPPTTIFLLSMRAGAVGINLTQANRVFLLEPCFNPALERQAIGRVHRLGQKRSVEIVKILMKNTVETRMTEMLAAKYGGNETTTDDDSEDADAKPIAKAAKNMIVGSVATDKATILGQEFDLLFGYEEAEEEAASGTSGDDKNAMPELVPSFVPSAAASSSDGGSGQETGII